MRLTKSDMHRKMYGEFIDRGMSHYGAMLSFPKKDRKQVEKDIKKSSFESRYGIKPIWALILGVAVWYFTMMFLFLSN